MIVDEYTLEVPLGGVEFGLAWYDPTSGIRLLTADTAQQGVVTVMIPWAKE